jgi:hypothetical protein
VADMVLVMCVLLSAYFIRGITGFGSGLISVPLLALSQPLHDRRTVCSGAGSGRANGCARTRFRPRLCWSGHGPMVLSCQVFAVRFEARTSRRTLCTSIPAGRSISLHKWLPIAARLLTSTHLCTVPTSRFPQGETLLSQIWRKPR